MSVTKEQILGENIITPRVFQRARARRAAQPQDRLPIPSEQMGKLLFFPSARTRSERRKSIRDRKQDVLVAIFDYFLSLGASAQDAKNHILALGTPDTNPQTPFIRFDTIATQKAVAQAVDSFRLEPGNTIASTYFYLSKQPGHASIVLVNSFEDDIRAIHCSAAIDNTGKPVRVTSMMFQ